jgi:hypothetical protein
MSVLALEGQAWRHPWHTRCQWNAGLQRWEAFINPATLVNALEPVASVLWDEAPEATRQRLQDEAGSQVDAWLSERPALPISEALRAIGGDAGPSGADANGQLTYEGVPEFFAARGVKEARKLNLQGESITQEISGLLAGDGEERLLRACELVLYLDRQATTTQWTTGAGIDGIVAQFTVTTYERPGARERAYVRVQSTWAPPMPRTAQDLLRGDWESEPTDEYHIATVYLLSPAGAGPGEEPDGSWQPFIKHSMFWNIHYGTNRLAPPLGKVQLSLVTGLAGGVGDPVNQWLLSQINDANSAVSEFLGREMIAGRRWTC